VLGAVARSFIPYATSSIEFAHTWTKEAQPGAPYMVFGLQGWILEPFDGVWDEGEVKVSPR